MGERCLEWRTVHAFSLGGDSVAGTSYLMIMSGSSYLTIITASSVLLADVVLYLRALLLYSPASFDGSPNRGGSCGRRRRRGVEPCDGDKSIDARYPWGVERRRARKSTSGSESGRFESSTKETVSSSGGCAGGGSNWVITFYGGKLNRSLWGIHHPQHHQWNSVI